MRVGGFKRATSYLVDAMPIIMILTLLFNWFVGDLLKPEGYDQAQQEYAELQDYYYSFLDPYEEQYENGEITIEEYREEYDNVMAYFTQAAQDELAMIADYFVRSVLYFVFGFALTYYVYSGFTKGKTVGRRMFKLELGGKVTWWRLFVREVVWKVGFWILTFGIGGIILDFAMIGLTKKKLTSRDIISGLYVKYEGVDYPF
jgi:hypothetical protein